MAAPAVHEVLQRAGLSVALTPERGLLVRPASLLTAELRSLVRQYRGELLAWLEKSESHDATQIPVADPAAWHALARAYHAHHFQCYQCIGAGRGARYGPRCALGEALWHEYTQHPP